MALKNLMARLQCRGADTPDTPEKIMGYQCKAPIHAGCTPDTPDTPRFVDTRPIVQTGQTKQAGNDPASAEPHGLENLQKPAMPVASNDPASTQPPDLVQPPAPAPDKPPKQTFMEWQDTWRELDQAYQRHHVNCPFCIAAGKGYGLRCGVGAALYTTYSDATQRTTP